MLVYFLTQNYGIEAVLLQGIYESMILAKGHLTWLVVSVLLFVIGDTQYRGKKERAKDKAQ